MSDRNTRAPITGAVCRVQPQWAHAQFLEAAEPAYAMVNLEDARRIVRRGEDASSYFPEATTTIATSTTHDDYLDLIPWESNEYRQGELEIVDEFAPDYYVPMDHSDYEDLPHEERLERIQSCCHGTLWLEERLEAETELIPLLKGCTLEERMYSYELFDELDSRQAAYYVASYFGEGGNHIGRLVDDLETISEETDVPLLLIGLLSPNYLARLPGPIDAASGLNAWREDVTPRKENALSIRRTYEQLETAVAGALGLPETTAGKPPVSVREPSRESEAGPSS